MSILPNSQGDLRNWLKPLESIINIDVSTLHAMMRSRHTIAHTDLRASTKQQQFVESLSSFVLPPTFAYKSIFEALVKKMESQKTYKRKSF